jgi:hypothetical protein
MRHFTSNRCALRVERLEDRTTPVVALFATGPASGMAPIVNVYSLDSAKSYHKVGSFYAYEPGFTGGVNVATADVNGDGVDDIITGPGPGRAPTVNVIDGASLLKGQVVLLRSFNAYVPAFLGGVYVAAGGTQNGTGVIITGAGAGGGPHVEEFQYATLKVVKSFFAYDPAFRGGVRVATSSVGGDIITGAGPGGGPHVKVYNVDGSLNNQFFAFDSSFRGGVFVGASFGLTPPGAVPGRTSANVIVTPGPGGPPVARLFDVSFGTVTLLYTVTPYPNFKGGLSAAVAQDNQKFDQFLVAAPGPGGGPDVRLFEDGDLQPVFRFFAYDPSFRGGVNVGGAR